MRHTVFKKNYIPEKIEHLKKKVLQPKVLNLQKLVPPLLKVRENFSAPYTHFFQTNYPFAVLHKRAENRGGNLHSSASWLAPVARTH